ncbi:MAG: stage II sporulation protein D [Bacilli bacterium]|nr:stage II sporulation protein D [Bacilli bacterium]MDD4298099.1 stage II sporulation protein D [Bacilli bacterium]
MKQTIYLTLLLISIPFFVVLFLYKQEIENKEHYQEENKLFVRVKREASNEIDTIELEDYVIGVLAGEMPISFHIEALKAQAVAARSYVLKRIEYNKNVEYDVVDSVTNQVYYDNDYLKGRWQGKYIENIEKLKEAVSETAYQYISYDGKIADALFFSTSNGFTENSEEIFSFELPYLRSVESAWDEKTSPVFQDRKTYDKPTFFKLLGLQDVERLEIEVLKKTSTGRVLNLKINGKEMVGKDVATKLKLRSNDFEIIKNGNIIEIKTNGYGHGVGMSQYGALGMANDGYLYDEILKYYYKGVEIETLK